MHLMDLLGDFLVCCYLTTRKMMRTDCYAYFPLYQYLPLQYCVTLTTAVAGMLMLWLAENSVPNLTVTRNVSPSSVHISNCHHV